jgi:hypothetical protein
MTRINVEHFVVIHLAIHYSWPKHVSRYECCAVPVNRQKQLFKFSASKLALLSLFSKFVGQEFDSPTVWTRSAT